MSSIPSQRPFFPPASSGQGSAPVNATKILREAQAAFFRPSAAAPAAVEPEAEPEAPATPTLKRPGSYLDIRV